MIVVSYQFTAKFGRSASFLVMADHSSLFLVTLEAAKAKTIETMIVLRNFI